jgi:hypothetical protein
MRGREVKKQRVHSDMACSDFYNFFLTIRNIMFSDQKQIYLMARASWKFHGAFSYVDKTGGSIWKIQTV